MIARTSPSNRPAFACPGAPRRRQPAPFQGSALGRGSSECISSRHGCSRHHVGAVSAAASFGRGSNDSSSSRHCASVTARASKPNEAAATAGGGGATAAVQPQQQQQQPKAKQQKLKQGSGGSVSEASSSSSGSSKAKAHAGEEALPPRSQDFSRWYLELVARAELADYGPVRGTLVIRPYGYAIWEAIQAQLDARLKARGVANAYFPQLIPLSFMAREAGHVAGFAPELALVTQGGGKSLEEPLALRPTSETMVNHMLARWVQSYRDLPLRLNQWCNVTRWEMRTRPFVRTLEFLWQEGHTAHATPEEAEAEALAMVRLYEEVAVGLLALPVVAGRKSRSEAFAGASTTYTIEAMMGDGKALQAGTSHCLGDNFAKAFSTQYLDERGQLQYVHQSSWGVSTRLIGALAMAHGDDAGLRLPPALAPIQVVIVPVVKQASEQGPVMEACSRLQQAAEGAGIRVKLDSSDRQTPGWKYHHWELKGVPLRVEVGPRDVAAGACVLARRDRPGKAGKQFGVPAEPAAFVAHVKAQLAEVQSSLLAQATAFRDAHIVDVASLGELREAVAAGKWARCGWAGSDADEALVKEQSQATLRCFPFHQPPGPHTCVVTGGPAPEVAIFAKAY